VITTRGAQIAVLALLTSFTTVWAQERDASESKAPVPTPLARKDAEKSVRRAFRSGYAKRGADDRRDLARELLAEGKKSSVDAVTRYVLLDEARSIAASIADLGTARSAIARLTRDFRVDRVALTEETLLDVPRVRKSADVAALHDAWQDLVDRAVEEDDYETAERLAESAYKSMRKCGDKALSREAKDRIKVIETIGEAYQEVAKFLAELIDDPDATEAQREVAQFLCLYKRDWDEGLALAVAGGDGPLKSAAQLDAASPKAPLGQVDVGNAWADLGKTYKDDVPREGCYERAVLWFERALLALGKVASLDVEKRLASIYKEFPNLRVPLRISDFDILTYKFESWRSKWKKQPTSSVDFSRSGDALRVKNTTGSSNMALATKDELKGDFKASLEVYGAKTVGIITAELYNMRRKVQLGRGWQRVKVERTSGKVTFTVNNREVKPDAGGLTSPTGPEGMAGRLYLGLSSGGECRIRNLRLWFDPEAEESESIEDWWRGGRGRGGRGDDDDDDDDNSGRGRGGGRR